MRWCPFVAFVGVLASQLPAAIPADDGPLGHRAIKNEVVQWVRGGSFAELEVRAAEFRASRERFADGEWKLVAFYEGLSGPATNTPDDVWRERLAWNDRWLEARPDSMTARVARGKLLARYAWNARGNGRADKVSDAGWKLFFERLVQSRNVLDEAKRRAGDAPLCPVWFDTMMTVALGQQWPRREFEALYAAAVRSQPDFDQFYVHKAHYLLPRWYGEPGEWQKFARDVREQRGPGVFALICWHNGALSGERLFSDGNISWPDVQNGYLELLERNPRSVWLLNSYARMARLAADRKTAAELFRKIGNDYYSSAWTSREAFETTRRWALGSRATTEVPASTVIELERQLSREKK